MNRKLLSLAILLAHQPVLVAQESADSIQGQRQQVAGPDIEEIAVVGQYIPDEKRETAAISNVLDAEAFQKAGDSNVADGLKRVAGLNLSGGRFVYIRGLGERYSSTMLNGSTLPSPEPIRRVVPLDLFPSSIIDSVLVQKTFSAQFPAEFAGGTIQMRTKVVPDAPFFQLNSSLGYSGQTSFEDGLTYDGGGKDWLGADDGTRDIPDLLKQAIEGDRELKKNNIIFKNGFSAQELEEIGESLANNYAVTAKRIDPDMGIGTSFGSRFEKGDAVFGFLSNLSYSNTWDTIEVARNSYTVNTVDGEAQITPFNEQVFNATEHSIDTSMFFTAGVEYQMAHTLKGTVLQIRKTDDQASMLSGLLATEDVDIRQNRLEWIERDLLSTQLEGEHVFDDWNELTVNWHYNESRAKRDAPDMRQYRYDYDQNEDRYAFSVRGDANIRMYSFLEDQNEDLGMNARMYLETPFNTTTMLSAGFTQVRKERDSEIRRFTFISQGAASNDEDLRSLPLDQVLSADNIAATAFELRESTRPTDNYKAAQELDAYFVEADVEVNYHLRLLAGLRWEESLQNVTTFDLFDRNADPIVSELKNKEVFPVFTGTWVSDNNMQFRLGYSETISRPDFRELSPAPFTHPVTGFEIVGNPDLDVAFIKNYDFRWEWYFTGTESVSVGLFYKDFDKPIEAVIEPGTESRRSFANAQSAETYGIELDVMRYLEFINEDWANWYLASNLSLIESDVTLSPESAGILTNSNRRLQGQADYIFNLQVGFDDGFKNRGSLVYHITGEKIREVGILGAPDVMDEAYGELDFVYTRNHSDKLEFGIKAKNLLNKNRDTTQGGYLVNGFTEGRSLSLSLNYLF